MKTKNIVLLSSFLFLLAGCGSNDSSISIVPNPSSTKVSSVTPSSNEDSSDDDESSSFVQPVYSATVKDEKDSPVSSMSVQWCTDSMCLLPVTTDSNGYAENKKCKDGNTYYVHLQRTPKGYAYDTNAYVENQDNRHVDMVIYPIVETTDNTISKTGVYVADITTADTYVTYTVSLEAGIYNFVSWFDYGMMTTTDVEFDPSFALLDSEGKETATDTDSGYDKNFSYDLTVAASTTYTIGVKANKVGSFNFNVTKK